MNYSDYIARLDTLAGGKLHDYPVSIPAIIEYAEQRMYRELDLLGTFETVAGTPLVSGTRTTAVPSGMIVVQGLNVLVAGRRYPLARISVDALNWMWPDPTATDLPRLFAMPDNVSVLLAPTPGAIYSTEFLGTFRPTALSSTTTTTLLTLYVPDAFVLCSMVFLSSYGDPSQAVVWEAQYQASKNSTDMEAARQKAQGSQWQPYSPTKEATPPRM